jgi:plastocyanin
MKSLLLIISISISMLCFSQTNHQIVANSMSWSPSALTVLAGDTVTWVSNSGTHNVNGTTSTFSLNPESFGNSVSSSAWTYQHVFTITGSYDFQCDVHAGSGMNGNVTVISPTYISSETQNNVTFYPNPTSKEIIIELDRVYDNIYVKLSSINGQLISINEYGSASKIYFEIEEPSGIYFIEVSNNTGEIAKLKVVKK